MGSTVNADAEREYALPACYACWEGQVIVAATVLALLRCARICSRNGAALAPIDILRSCRSLAERALREPAEPRRSWNRDTHDRAKPCTPSSRPPALRAE